MDNERIEEDLNEQFIIRREKLNEMKSSGEDPFLCASYGVSHRSVEIKDDFEKLENTAVSVAGRLMSKRLMGKASFCDIQDRDGRIQAYISEKDIGGKDYDAFKHYDIGDIVGVKGDVFKTRTGEISIKAKELKMLSKSLRVPPEKFHGFKDQEARYRQRYLDLIFNLEVKDTFLKRTAIIKSLRNTLDGRGYTEVQTPVLQSIPSGAEARPFSTRHNTLDMDMFLRISLELPLKRLIVGGLEKVYEIGQVFRNEGISTRHYPEFMMLELYEAYTDFHGMMELAESLIKNAAFIGASAFCFNNLITAAAFAPDEYPENIPSARARILAASADSSSVTVMRPEI